MLSKWEWIEKACEIQGYIESAKMAQKIEEALKKIYCMQETKYATDLEEFQSRNALWEVGFDAIHRFASDPMFCIGCEMTTTNGCNDCLFGKKYGFCDRKSIFGEFVRTLIKEHKKDNQNIL